MTTKYYSVALALGYYLISALSCGAKNKSQTNHDKTSDAVGILSPQDMEGDYLQYHLKPNLPHNQIINPMPINSSYFITQEYGQEKILKKTDIRVAHQTPSYLNLLSDAIAIQLEYIDEAILYIPMNHTTISSQNSKTSVSTQNTNNYDLNELMLIVHTYNASAGKNDKPFVIELYPFSAMENTQEWTTTNTAGIGLFQLAKVPSNKNIRKRILTDIPLPPFSLDSNETPRTDAVKTITAPLQINFSGSIGTVFATETARRTYSLINSGDSAVEGISLVYDEQNFTIISNECETEKLQPHTTCDIEVGFAIDAVGAFASEFIVEYEFLGKKFSVKDAISGKALSTSQISISGTADFGTPALDQEFIHTFTLTNQGGFIATEMQISISAPYYIVNSNCISDEIPPQADCTVEIGVKGQLEQTLGELKVQYHNGANFIEETLALKLDPL